MSFLSGFAGLAGLLPGYINGRRQAIQDDWTDRFNWNRDYDEQLTNALNTATWGNQVELSDFARDNAYFQTRQNAINSRLYDYALPQYYAQILAGNAFAPILSVGNQFGNLAMMRMMMQGAYPGLSTKSTSIGG